MLKIKCDREIVSHGFCSACKCSNADLICRTQKLGGVSFHTSAVPHGSGLCVSRGNQGRRHLALRPFSRHNALGSAVTRPGVRILAMMKLVG